MKADEVFFMTDLHLGHRKIIEYEPLRTQLFADIDEHDRAICSLWRERVRKQNVVYVLGDVAFNRVALERIRNLPGKKKLILGNHDKLDMKAYLEVFVKVSAYDSFDGVVLSHIPLNQCSILPRYRGNVHGHLHGRGDGPSRYHLNICPEVMGDFGPLTWQKIAPLMNVFVSREEYDKLKKENRI